MAKKAAKKASKKTARKSAKKAAPTHPAPADPSRGRTEPLLPEQVATAWAMREENASLRQIATELGCSHQTIARIFQADPGRHATLVTAQREERAARWRSIEGKSLIVLDGALSQAQRLVDKLGRTNAKISQGDHDRAQMLRVLISPIRMAADSATAKTQLLVGQPTEITQGVPAGIMDPSQMTDEEVVSMAIEHEMVDQLPPRLREIAAKRDADRID